MSINTRGFTLIEAMIAMGLSAAVTTGAVTFLSYANSQRLTLEAQSNVQQLGRDIAQETEAPAACLDVLQGLKLDPDAKNEMDFGIKLRGKVVGTGTTLATDHLFVKRLWFTNVMTVATPGPNGVPLTLADVMLDAQMTTPNPVVLRPRSIARVYMEVSGGSLLSCTSNRSLPNVLQLTCAQMGGTFVAATSSCDMTPFVNKVIADARNQIDEQLYGPYQAQVMAKINTDVNVAMANAKANSVAAAGVYTGRSMASVNANLVQNQYGLNNSIANLNQLIATNVANLTAGLNSTTAQANSVYQLAQTAYENALASYANAVGANGQANQATALATSASYTAQTANANAQGARNTAYYMTSVAWNAMNQATASANGASAANQYAANASGAASAALNAANGAVGYAQSAYGAANSAYNYIPGIYNWVNQVNGAATNAMNAANAAASSASYAAGVANSAANLAQYALQNIPRQTNIFITQVNFTPGAPPAPAGGTWGVGDGSGGICPPGAGPGGSCSPVGMSCWVFLPGMTINYGCR